MKQAIQNLLSQKMDRGQFLRTVGVFILGAIGFANISSLMPSSVTRVRTTNDVAVNNVFGGESHTAPRKFGT